MKIVLATLNAKYIHTSLSIRYLKAYAEPEYTCELAEYTIKDPTLNIVSDLYSRKPDVVGFSCYIWNIQETIHVISLLKKVLPNVKVVLGGPEVTYDVDEWLDHIPSADYFVIGEGEATFKQLLACMDGKEELKHIHGIAYKQAEKKVIQLQQNKLDLKTLPSPYRFPEDKESLSKRVVYMETSRGCPFNCQFCLSSIEIGVRYFNREKIKEDIRYLLENGAKTIKFVDRTFNISRSYAMEMFQFLIDEHTPGSVFQFEITADIMRPEVIQFLNDHAPAGLFRFEIGVQSTNDHTNDLVMRKQNFDKLTRTVTMVKEGGKIDQHLDLIAGLPEENYDSFKKTFNDVFALKPEELQLGFLKMLRGTGLRIRSKEYGYVYSDFAPYEIVSNNVLSFADIIKIKQVEDVLEKYWNDHRMDNTLYYLTDYAFPTPFDFFQDFGSFWEEKGWSKIGHQLEDLFKRLSDFLETQNFPNKEEILSLMKYDYLNSSRYKPRKPWWSQDDSFSKEQKTTIYKQIVTNPSLLGDEFVSLQLQERDLHKHTVLEKIINRPSEEKELTQHILLCYFDPAGSGSKLFTAPLQTFI